MSSSYIFEDTGEYDEDYESDEDFESDEAVKGRPKPPVRTAKRGNVVPMRAPQGFATKADLKATADRLDARIATNSKAVMTLESRARAAEAEAAKNRAHVKRELAGSKTATDGMKASLDQLRQLTILLPLLSTQTTADLSAKTDSTGTNLGLPNDVVVDTGDTFSKLLPILLLSGGFGGSSSTPGGASGGLFGGDGVTSLALILALTGGGLGK